MNISLLQKHDVRGTYIIILSCRNYDIEQDEELIINHWAQLIIPNYDFYSEKIK